MAAGDFSATEALAIRQRADEVWADSQLARGLDVHADAAVALVENQTARLVELERPDKDREVRLIWVNPCPVETQACTTDCDIEGDELESTGKDYALTKCREVTFSVDLEKPRTNDIEAEELRAIGMAKSLKALDEWLAVQVLLSAKAFAGPNMYPTPYTYAAGTTTIPAADYNLAMVANIENAAYFNHMEDAFFIDNGTLWPIFRNAQLDRANLNGQGNFARYQALDNKFYFDRYNFGRAGLTEDLFAINPGAMALATKARYGQAPVFIAGQVQQMQWSVPSRSLRNVRYDVSMTIKCTTDGTGQSHYAEHFKVKTRFDILQNPNGCPETIGGTTYTPTGIISFSKGA